MIFSKTFCGKRLNFGKIIQYFIVFSAVIRRPFINDCFWNEDCKDGKRCCRRVWPLPHRCGIHCEGISKPKRVRSLILLISS